MNENVNFEFYSEQGKTDFYDFLKSIPEKDALKLLTTIHNIEELGLTTAIKMQWVKRLDADIFEVRSKLASNIQRALYFQKVNHTYIITHAFTKKTQKTPKIELDKAHQIMKKYLRGDYD